jgi:capsid assembly protease
MPIELTLARAASMPWALEPGYLHAVAAVLARKHLGEAPSAADLAHVRADREARDTRRDAAVRAGNGAIAVIPVFGVITQRGNMLDELCGGGSVSTEMLVAQLRQAEADDSVGSILLNFNTPGGSVYGVGEAADEIVRIGRSKPVVGLANSLSASAGYWLMAQCTEVYCTPGGEVGSIGVWQAHEDVSKALATKGVTVSLISAGKYKTEGNPFGPLDPAARGFMQQRTDEYYTAFTDAVARGRRVGVATVRNGMGQGRVLGAKQALEERMVDGVATFDQVVAHMRRGIGRSGPGARATLSPAQAAQRIAQLAGSKTRAQIDHERREREIQILEAEG